MISKIKKWKSLILCICLFTAVIGLGSVVLTQMVPKEIRLIIDGQACAVETKSCTVEEFLKEEKIHLAKEDSLKPAADTFLEDGSRIEIVRAVPVTLQADGNTTEVKTLPGTVEHVLEKLEVTVDGDDKVRPALSQTVTAGTEIVINRITKEIEEVAEPVNFRVRTTGSDELAAGTTKVLQKGRKGKEQVTYEVTYSDGKESKREELDRQLVKKPRDKIVAKSTRGMIQGKEYKEKFTVKAYAYTGGGTTAMGTQARVGEIAVDPSVIPLGTEVYVEGYGFARAEDTGGNIKGNTVDVYKNTESECLNWGVRNVTIYILSK